MNIWDILILALVALAVLAAVRQIRKNKGSCSCGSSCECCQHGCDCQKTK